MILAFGAHPDDIEFGCGGIIAVETARGASAHFVVCSRGEAATHGSPQEREREARAAAAILGATIEFADLGGDAHFAHTPAHALTLAALIRRVRPSLVLAPSPAPNQHPDHVALSHLVRDGCRLARYVGLEELKALPAHAIGTLLHYAISPDAEPPTPPLLVDISPAVPQWTQAMEAHGSQMKTRNYLDLQLTRAHLWGQRAGVSHAQPLYPADPIVLTSLAPLTLSARRF